MNSFGKCISKLLFLVNPINICSAANSGDLIIGIGKLFWSVKGVFIKPGDTSETLILYFLRSKFRVSAKDVRADFDAQYPAAAGKPL